jgi:predicted RND superfamily exporter protein
LRPDATTTVKQACAGMQRNITTRQESPGSPRMSAVAHTLRALTRISARWPRFIMAIVILASCACAGYTFFFLKFKTDRTELLDPQAEFHKHWQKYSATFEHASQVTVVAETGSTDEIKRILDEVADRLKREPENFSHVLCKVDAGPLQHKWLQYVKPRQLQVGLRRIAEYSPILRGDWSRIELDSLFNRLGEDIEARLDTPADSTKKPTPSEMRQIFKHSDLLTASLDHFLANPAEFHSPWPDLVPMDTQTRALKEETAYYLSDRGTMGYLRVVPRKDPAEATGEWRALTRLEEINAEVAEAHPGAKIGLTGVPILENEEMRRSQWDMGYAVLIAAGGCLVLMVIGFRGVRHPMLVLVMLAASITWALGFTTEMIGHLSIFSLAVVSILFALGIEFAITYASRYLQLRREGWQLRPALMETTGKIGTGTITAAVTAALAFLCTLLADYVGVAELGIIAAAGILLCALATFFVLPALISLADQNADSGRMPKPLEWNVPRKLLGRFPLATLAVSAVVVIGVGSQIVKIENHRIVPRLRFDSNLLNLQAQDAESVRLERRLSEESSNPLLFAVSVADSERQMRELHAKFERLASVGHVESLAMRLPTSTSDETRQLLAQYRAQLASVPARLPAIPNADPIATGKAIENFYRTVKKYADEEHAKRVADATDSFLNHFEKLSQAEQTRLLNAFQYRMAVDMLDRFQAVRYASNDEEIQAGDLPQELISRFVSPADAEGKRKFLLQIYPKERIWDEAPLTHFVGELRSVDPNVTGTPIQNHESVRQIRHSYETAALYAFAVVWIVLLVDFLGREVRWLALLPTLLVTVLAAVMLHARHIQVDPMVFAIAYVIVTGAIALVIDARNLRNAAIAYSVPLAGGLVMFGIFARTHIDLNPANLMILPLLLGIGVNYGVQVVHDYRSQKGQYQISGNTFGTVVLTALTSMVGFGSMMVASHRGLFSLGIALAIGILSCLFVSLVFVPSLLGVLSKNESVRAATNSKGETKRAVEPERKARAA